MNSLLLTCRFCQENLNVSLINLGLSPLSNSYLTKDDLTKNESFYPLHVRICENCFLAQLPQFESPENIFNDYAYYSSYSESWLEHSKEYVELVAKKFKINKNHLVIEIASNDGYLLQYFKEKDIPTLGIEPAKNVADVAIRKDITTITKFFGKKLAQELTNNGYQANLLIANNVLAHVPLLNDFVAGLKIILKQNGILTVEFPHLLRLIKENQFDTIYHEHFSYFSLMTVQKVFEKHELSVFDVEEIPVHGGSLRVYVKHTDNTEYLKTANVDKVLQDETKFGLNNIQVYQSFSSNVEMIKSELKTFLISENKKGKQIVGYGAPAKGNTLLNYYGINAEIIPYTVDKNPYKQNRFLPGTHIPIFRPEKINITKPDYLLLLPWNIKNEIMSQMAHIRDWGGKFIVPIPQLEVI